MNFRLQLRLSGLVPKATAGASTLKVAGRRATSWAEGRRRNSTTRDPILIVDGDADCRDRASGRLLRAGFAIHEAGTAEEALAAARHKRPALVLLEVELRDARGYELCRELRDEYGEGLPIILLSGERTEPSDRVAGLLIGADDYIVKPFDPDELVARVRRAVIRAAAAQREARPPPRFRLTQRERDILELLAGGLGPTAIAQEFVISPKTVSSHIQRILVKLGVHSRAEAVALAYREGLAGDVRAH